MDSKGKRKDIIRIKEKGIGGTRAAKEYGISRAQYFNWTKAYLEQAIKVLENKKVHVENSYTNK